MTEASIVTVNTPERRKIGSVGTPIDTIQVKTSPEGESVGQRQYRFGIGYYKNPKATAEAFDAEGWLRTGDKATIDSEGFVTIVGRIKELFKSSVGEYIAPVPIEQQICKAPFIDLAMIVAEQRKYVSCLLFPNFEVVASLKKSLGQDNLSDQEFLASDYIAEEMSALIEQVNSKLNHWEQIRAYRFVPSPPAIETGELTPSMKIRREAVAKKYKDLIDSMYPVEAVL